MSENNEWELSSGLALDGATGTITAMEFGFNAKIGAGVLCANMSITPDDGGEVIEQSFSVGKGWDASRDGSELVREGGGGGSINKSTNFGILIASAIDCLDGDGSKLGGTPRSTETWIGTTWDWGTVKHMTRNPTTGAEAEKDKFVVTKYHGRDGAAAAAKPAGAAKKAAAATEEIDPELWDKLVALAGEHAEHDTFVEAALDLPEVEGSKPAQKAVMGTRAGSVWAAKG